LKSLTNQKYLRDTLHKFGFFTKKNLWQNFLISSLDLEDIVKAADISKEDYVIEIWPGPWVLTQELVQTWATILALEVDETVIPILNHTTWNADNLTVENMSALEYEAKTPWYILCANIPYYLTSPIIRHYLWWKVRPKRIVFLMQKEVAQKICASSWNESVLSLQVKIYWKAEIIKNVARDCFFPAPKVDSSILKITVFEKPLIEKEDIVVFWDIVHHLFTEKRKKISNTFSKYRQMWAKNAKIFLEQLWIDLSKRPQALSIDEWKKLVDLIKKI